MLGSFDSSCTALAKPGWATANERICMCCAGWQELACQQLEPTHPQVSTEAFEQQGLKQPLACAVLVKVLLTCCLHRYCGSCYLHATLSMIQDRLKINKGEHSPDVMLGRQSFLWV
jgi:hypothetical protein